MDVESFLKAKGLAFEKHKHATTYTSQGLAHEEKVSGYIVAKPVIVKGKAGFVMCVLSAPRHVDLKSVAEVLSDSTIRLATEAEMAENFPGCELGAEPPIGELFNMKTIMDPQLEEDEHLVMQAGKHTESIRMRRTDWQKACNPLIASIAVG